MNKKGFTLTELLGVVIILALICLIAIPTLIDGIRSNKEELGDATKNIIYSATDLYLSNNSNSYPKFNGSTYCIVLNDLVSSGDLLNNLYDVETNSKVDLTKIVKVEVVEGIYKKNIVERNECDRYVNFNYNSNISAVEGNIIPRCVTDNYTCTKEEIRTGLSVMVNVDGTNNYKFYIINDANGILTLIAANNYGSNVMYSSDGSNENGPETAITNLPTDWVNVINNTDIINDGIMIDYDGYDARLPKAIELAKLSSVDDWNQTAISTIPNFLKENLDSGYWTSTINGTTKAWKLDSSLSNTTVTSTLGTRPVINIYKYDTVLFQTKKKIEEIVYYNNTGSVADRFFEVSSNSGVNINSAECLIEGVPANYFQEFDGIFPGGEMTIICSITTSSGEVLSATKPIYFSIVR